MDEVLVTHADLSGWVERVSVIDLEIACLKRERWELQRRLDAAKLLWPDELAALQGEPPEVKK